MKAIFKKRSINGDTIVEVMMSLVILSMILATVYAMGSRSLRVGTESNQRTEALGVAQSQVELLINAKNVDPVNFATNFQTNQPYCIKSDGTKDISAQNNATKLCSGYNGTAYNVGVAYSSNVFTITAQWPSTGAPNGTANLNLYYKLPGVYKKALVTAGSVTGNGLTFTLNGIVNPNGNLVTDCYFNYDTSTTYSQAKRVSCSSLPGSGTDNVNVSASISGLPTNSTYYFQICATNIVGTSCSDNNGTFTTPSAPVVSNQVASNLDTASGNTATLSGYIDPKGYNVTSCYFEYGLTTSYGSTAACGGSIGTTAQTVTQNIASLGVNGQTSVTYHWRLVAVSSIGNGNGPDAQFTVGKKTPTATLSVSSNSIAYGAGVTFTWVSSYTTSCSADKFATGGLKNSSSPVSSGALTATTTFTLTCTNNTVTPAINVTSSQTVTVGAPPLPPPPPALAWMCGNFWGEWKCAGPFGPGDYGWVESYGIQNDSMGWVLVQNTVIGLYAGVHFNTYDGGDGGICDTISSYKNFPESLGSRNIGRTSSFTVGRGC